MLRVFCHWYFRKAIMDCALSLSNQPLCGSLLSFEDKDNYWDRIVEHTYQEQSD